MSQAPGVARAAWIDEENGGVAVDVPDAFAQCATDTAIDGRDSVILASAPLPARSWDEAGWRNRLGAGMTGILGRAVLAAVGYIAIMAVGMFTTGHVFGITYGDPAMVYVLVFFEAVMSIYAVVMARRMFGAWHCGFGPADWGGMWWLVPNFALMAALFVIALRGGAVGLSGLALVVIVTMILVGFSEELMFRGIVLRGGLRTLGTGKAILVSAAMFSLLHSVNVLAFVPLGGMLFQLVLTFVFGLAMACYGLRANSLVPLIVFHALWDMVQFLGGIFQADFGSLIDVGIIVNAVVAAVLWWTVLRKRTGGSMGR